jgi:nitrile hydratase subunit alpha
MNDHHHDHGHHHDHDHSELSDIELRVRALESILTEKGYVDPAAIDVLVETYETRIGPRNGAKVVAKAWTDPAFREWLLADATAAIASLGFTGRQGEHMVAAPYRSRAVLDPRGVLAEFGVELPKPTRIRVWDSTAEVRYLVVPMRPEGTEGWSEDALADLVTRDSMIGVGLALRPDQVVRA